ncbi:GntR family transcriptional regulator, partial [Streptococcus pneumoniae]|uniref:GntR family transcriptional regulator n=1 Tax=Streptococcus pneumoniae TaxID=1313 RepID=UPI0034511ED9
MKQIFGFLFKFSHLILAVGDFLPSEHDLMEQYQVSRDTVRKALSLLQEEG